MASITVGQWLEWLAWINIRGPVGGPRQDYYNAFLAMHAGGPYEDKKMVTEFYPPWTPPPEPEPDDDDDD